MSNPSAKLSVLVGKDFACVKIAGRANFMSSPDFKTLISRLKQKGCNRFILELSECVLMDSTFLGVLAGFGLKTSPGATDGKCDIELANPNARVAELLDNLGVMPLFKITSGPVQLPANAVACAPELASPTQTEITRTSLEAHQTLMAAHPDNVARFKDVAQFLAEDLKNLEKPS
jgi:anti-anti-sigma factor